MISPLESAPPEVLGVLMPGTPGVEVPHWLAAALGNGLGGVCLFAENTPDLARARDLTDQIHQLGPQTCICIDEEGGDVTRLQRTTGSSLPGNAALGWVDDLTLTERAGAAIGRLVRAAGVDLNLAPCLDVCSNPMNPTIATRSFGPYSDQVADHGVAWLAGLHTQGIGGCAKHFPGHGDSVVDSHVGVPYVDVPPQRLSTRDVAPFAANRDLDAVMVGHIVVPSMGSDPASVSPWAYRWLRELGFGDRPLITDALGMHALAGAQSRHPGMGEACVRALEAGADLCCLDAPMNRDAETSLMEAVVAIMAALDQGRLSIEGLIASAARTRALVAQLGERRARHPEEPFALAPVAQTGREIATRALVVRGQPELRPGTALFVDLRVHINRAWGMRGSVILDAINAARGRHGQPEAAQVGLDGLAAALADPGEPPEVVLQTRQPVADAAEAEALAIALACAPDAVVIHTGMMGGAPPVPRMVCTHGFGRPNGWAAAQLLVGPSD